jgi:hypothetical protein
LGNIVSGFIFRALPLFATYSSQPRMSGQPAPLEAGEEIAVAS